jgi:hypothetical protein
MSTVVYLIGHGRVDSKAAPAVLPQNVTVHWLAPLGDTTAGLSHAFLSGRLNAEDSHSDPGSSVVQHYLCSEHADVDPQNDLKIRNFFSRNIDHPHGSRDPYVLYPRAQVNVSLSSICSFLEKLSPTNDWHVYWTCCRGYVGQNNEFETRFRQGKVVRERRVNPPPTPALTAQGHRTIAVDFNTVVMVAKSDRQVIETHADFTMGKGKYAPQSHTNAIKAILRL